MKNYTDSSFAVVSGRDYCTLICSVYHGLKAAIARALREKRKARAAFCDAVGINDTGRMPGGVGVVNVRKGDRVLTVLDGDRWIEAIDIALLFIKEEHGEECYQAIYEHFVNGKSKTDACAELKQSYSMFTNVYCLEFVHVLLAEAAARGLVVL